VGVLRSTRLQLCPASASSARALRWTGILTHQKLDVRGPYWATENDDPPASKRRSDRASRSCRIRVRPDPTASQARVKINFTQRAYPLVAPWPPLTKLAWGPGAPSTTGRLRRRSGDFFCGWVGGNSNGVFCHPTMPKRPYKWRSLRSNSEESGLTAAPTHASFADYWCLVAAPEQTGELVRECEKQALRRALAQVNAFTAKDERQLLAKQRGRCAICGRRLAEKCHLNQIIPLAAGGSYAKSNLQIVHPMCNFRKHANDNV